MRGVIKMESAIQIFDYINDGEFALIYEGKLN